MIEISHTATHHYRLGFFLSLIRVESSCFLHTFFTIGYAAKLTEIPFFVVFEWNITGAALSFLVAFLSYLFHEKDPVVIVVCVKFTFVLEFASVVY